MQTSEVIKYVLQHCGDLRPSEHLLLLTDTSTVWLEPYFTDATHALGASLEILRIPKADRHGVEPPAEVLKHMQKAQLMAGLTFKSIAHSATRLKFTDAGGRYLSLPGYDETLLSDPALLTDFRAQFARTLAITDLLTQGKSVRVSTKAGTDITLDIQDRIGNCCPGFVNAQYRLGSPPDIEANVSPVEAASNGIVVVDGSVACEEIGLLSTPITLHVEGGKIVRFSSANKDYVLACEQMFSKVGSAKAYVLAECGIGLNPAARLTGNMLTDEGVLGCVHFGFGSNATVGGKNDVPFHVDFVFKQASLWIDEQAVLIDGEPCL